LRLTELPELNISSIDWEKKLLHIDGARKREIPLNDEVFEAVSAWSRDRIDSPAEALFVTSKGEQKRISSRGIDKLLRKYGLEAGIQKHVNAQLLRNTFGVHLLAKETSIDNAAVILGVTDPQSLKRFMKSAKDEKEGIIPSQDLEKLDTRPKIIRHLSKLIHPKHKEARIIKPSAPSDQAEITIGRNAVLSEIKENLSKELSILIVGPPGMGKTHILNVIAKEGGLYIDSPAPIKQFLQKLCEKYCPDWSQRLPSKSRSSAKEIVELLSNTLKERDKKDLLLIDNLDSVKASDIEILLMLFDSFTILAATEETPSRLKELWWKFRRIDLLPLDREASKELIKHLTSGLTIADYELLETRILSISNGLPLAIVEMVGQVSHLSVVKKEDAREVYHEAGVKYRDWTAVVIILWSIATSSRFINLGAQSPEGYILAVLGMAALVGGIRFLRTR
ncbi:MAG: tyrosine-type recombinase/integrase, partial [Candidatus Margulisiibacteriota bacterium]